MHTTFTICSRPAHFDVYRFKRPRYLTKLAAWIFSLLSIPVYEDVAHRVTVKEDDILALIRRARGGIDSVWRGEVKHLICGPEEFSELLDKNMRGPVSFTIPLHLANGDQMKCFGMQVHVIPWFEGVLMLPDLENNR